MVWCLCSSFVHGSYYKFAPHNIKSKLGLYSLDAEGQPFVSQESLPMDILIKEDISYTV
jgi:hypothetical protein